MEIVWNAHAKINLFLDITGRRADGYHTITGVMQAVSLADRVRVCMEGATGRYLCSLGACPGKAETISLICSNPDLPTDARNLAWRAADAFFAATGRGCRHLTIDIEKHIPAAAGLAGGSTDAAAVLLALNELCDRPLTIDELCAVGLKLGADVPFCMVGGTQKTEGVGEILTPLPAMPACSILLACAGEGVSTPAAYRSLDEQHGNFAPDAYMPALSDLSHLITALDAGSLEGIGAHAFNLFESVILPDHSMASSIKETMRMGGAVVSMMSGSGPSVFGIFHPEDERIEITRRQLADQGIPAWICEPVRL